MISRIYHQPKFQERFRLETRKQKDARKRQQKLERKKRKEQYLKLRQEKLAIAKAERARQLQDLETKEPAWYPTYLKSEHWQSFRLTILSKRGSRCEGCSQQVPVEVRHKTYSRLNCEKDTDVEVLCEACHAMRQAIRSQGRVASSEGQRDEK